jgi:hypothetical protein
MASITVHDRPASTTVLVKRPTQSHATGQILGWTKTHAHDCSYVAHTSDRGYPYDVVDVSEIPPHVGHCSICGGGR